MERLVAGRERIYLDRFWNEFSADPKHFDEASRRHYAKLYARPGAMHSGFAQFAAFDQDAVDNRAFLASGRLKMPVLAVGGGREEARGRGSEPEASLKVIADDVTGAVVADCGHFVPEERPDELAALLLRHFENR
jgi:pimeloyl-ACP methyl ester carboxylesterase